jgi:uncharacterized protein YbaA (DUF1428 family)
VPAKTGSQARYVDGFVIPIRKQNLDAYKRLARKAGKIWMEHGALEYRECIGEDLSHEFGAPFPGLVGAKRGETVIFSWITYRSRKHRDAVNKKVMADPRLQAETKKMPFDVKRMAYGGFDIVVDAKPAVD